jgi:hypothetical protein
VPAAPPPPIQDYEDLAVPTPESRKRTIRNKFSTHNYKNIYKNISSVLRTTPEPVVISSVLSGFQPSTIPVFDVRYIYFLLNFFISI